MGLTIVMPYSFCAIANTAWFSKWMLADTTGIVYMAFLDFLLALFQLLLEAVCHPYRKLRQDKFRFFCKLEASL